MTDDVMRNAMATVLLESAREELESAWKDMWHNGAIHDMPYDEIADDEWDLFYDRLGDYVRFALEDIQEQISERFDEVVTLYQYGRNGATIAPDEYMYGDNCGGFGSYRAEWDEEWDDDPVNILASAKKELAVITFINEQAAIYAAGVPEWWKEEKTYWKEEQAA